MTSKPLPHLCVFTAIFTLFFCTTIRVADAQPQFGEEQKQIAAIYTAINIGKAYADQGQYKKALKTYQQALEIHQEIGDQEREGGVLSSIGSVYFFLDEYEKALAFYQKALAIHKKIGYQEGIWCRIFVYRELVKLLFKLHKSDQTKKYDKQAFHYTERGKSRTFVELLYEAKVRINKGGNTEWLEAEERLYNRLFRINKTLEGKLSEAQRNNLMEERENLELQLQSLKRKLKTNNPLYAELKYPEPVSVEQVRDDILNEGEVLVEYLQGAEEISVFVIGKQNFHIHTLKVDLKKIIEKLHQLVGPFHDKQPDKRLPAFDTALAHELYQTLFQPLEDKIATVNGNQPLKTLIIIPDFVLFYLPFEILVTKVQKASQNAVEYLVNKYSIVYAPFSKIYPFRTILIGIWFPFH